MYISEEEQKKLKKLWEEKAEITIKGFNEFGDSFETTGRISTIEGEAYAGKGYIMLEFGVSKNSSTDECTKWTAPYFFNLNKADMQSYVTAPSFIIEEVLDSEGNVLIENTDREEYLNAAQALRAKVLKENMKEGRELDKNSDYYNNNLVLKTLCEECVGKPITIDRQNYVFVGCNTINNMGRPALMVVDGTCFGTALIDYNSMLIQENNNGEKSLLADNGPSAHIIYSDMVDKRNEIQKIESRDF